MKNQNIFQKGYIAIISVLTISAVALVIAVTVSFLAIGEAQSSLTYFKGENTLAFVEGCMEDALIKIKGSSTYAGGVIARPEGTCIITISKAGNVWTVTATTTSVDYKRTIRVIASRTGTLTLISWKEI